MKYTESAASMVEKNLYSVPLLYVGECLSAMFGLFLMLANFQGSEGRVHT